MPVQVHEATAAKIPETTDYLSILKSRHSAAININPQVEGQITKILVKSGDHVTAGTPLLQVETANGELMIPLAEDICTLIEITARRIEVRLPQGLGELNPPE